MQIFAGHWTSYSCQSRTCSVRKQAGNRNERGELCSAPPSTGSQRSEMTRLVRCTAPHCNAPGQCLSHVPAQSILNMPCREKAERQGRLVPPIGSASWQSYAVGFRIWVLLEAHPWRSSKSGTCAVRVRDRCPSRHSDARVCDASPSPCWWAVIILPAV